MWKGNVLTTKLWKKQNLLDFKNYSFCGHFNKKENKCTKLSLHYSFCRHFNKKENISTERHKILEEKHETNTHQYKTLHWPVLMYHLYLIAMPSNLGVEAVSFLREITSTKFNSITSQETPRLREVGCF